ncbi:MAG: hypothetical protein WA431_13800, partial [Candidatus Cybelea sp.]
MKVSGSAVYGSPLVAFSQNAIAFILTNALLVGCASRNDIPSAPPGVLQAAPDRSVNLTFVGKKKTYVGNEAMVGSDDYYVSPCPKYPRGGDVYFSASGGATGPYAGTFFARGQFYVSNCTSGKTSLTEAFTITSGGKTI